MPFSRPSDGSRLQDWSPSLPGELYGRPRTSAVNQAYQLEGRCTDVRKARDEEQAIPHRYAIAFAETIYTVGIPRSLIGRVNVWPAWAAAFEVRDIFSQTPGPGAGKRWGTR